MNRLFAGLAVMLLCFMLLGVLFYSYLGPGHVWLIRRNGLSPFFWLFMEWRKESIPPSDLNVNKPLLISGRFLFYLELVHCSPSFFSIDDLVLFTPSLCVFLILKQWKASFPLQRCVFPNFWLLKVWNLHPVVHGQYLLFLFSYVSLCFPFLKFIFSWYTWFCL